MVEFALPKQYLHKDFFTRTVRSAGASSTLHSSPSNSSYPQGYSADGIPPVLVTDHVTQAAASSITSSSDSAAHPGSIAHARNSSEQPFALKDTVPTATDKGFAEPPAINTTIDRGASQSGTIPVSPSKSPSFLSRVFNTFLGPAAEPAETTASRGYSHEAPSASWGRPSEPVPVEHIREAGAVRAADSGLDEPTATKHAGLDARSNDGEYQRSVPNTAVAAAEALVDDKANAQHETAVAGQRAPHSPGATPHSLETACRFEISCSVLLVTAPSIARFFCCCLCSCVVLTVACVLSWLHILAGHKLHCCPSHAQLVHAVCSLPHSPLATPLCTAVPSSVCQCAQVGQKKTQLLCDCRTV